MALIAALFMIVVVAALGVLALRFGALQQQTTNLTLLTFRTEAAATSGLEYASWLASHRSCAGAPGSIVIDNVTVTLNCPNAPSTHTIDGGPARRFFDVSVTATYGVYGRPDFVRRTASRRIGEIGVPQAW